MAQTEASRETFAGNRAKGAVLFDVAANDGVTRRRHLHESGSLRVRFPSPHGNALSAVLVNTAGGVAGGDQFDIGVTTGSGARLTVTTAAAEKIYRSHGPASRLAVSLRADAGSHLGWLPQETILFDRVQLERSFDIDLHETASLLMCEIMVFGRAAMGETMRQGAIADRWRLRIGGRLVFAETVRLAGAIGEQLARRAVAGGGGAVATALIVPGDAALVDRIREDAQFGGEVGVSAWNGFALARFCAQDAACLRADMIALLGRAGVAPLPRLWLN